MLKLIKKITLLTIIGLSLSACTTMNHKESKELDEDYFKEHLDQTYELVENDSGEIGQYTPVFENILPTIKLVEKNGEIYVSGNATCNQYNGLIVIEDNKIKVKSMISTRMVCHGRGAIMEHKLLTSLKQSSKIIFEDDKILITNDYLDLTFKKKI